MADHPFFKATIRVKPVCMATESERALFPEDRNAKEIVSGALSMEPQIFAYLERYYPDLRADRHVAGDTVTYIIYWPDSVPF